MLAASASEEPGPTAASLARADCTAALGSPAVIREVGRFLYTRRTANTAIPASGVSHSAQNELLLVSGFVERPMESGTGLIYLMSCASVSSTSPEVASGSASGALGSGSTSISNGRLVRVMYSSVNGSK